MQTILQSIYIIYWLTLPNFHKIIYFLGVSMVNKKRSRKNTTTKKHALQNFVLFIAIIMILVLLISAVYYALFSSANNAHKVVPNLTLNNINTVIQNASYTPVEVDKLTNFSGILKDEGYLLASVSAFNFSGLSNNTPPTITSTVLLTSNQLVANEMVESLLFSNNANQSIRGYVYNNTIKSDYSYYNISIPFYTVSSVAVFNNSVISNIEKSNESFTMPVFQYTTIFSYSDYIGVVVVNSYSYSNVYQNYSIKLAELLARKLIAYSINKS